MKLLLLAALAASAFGQNTTRWIATTGDVSLTAAATAATIQQPATNGQQVYIDQVIVYCSAACNITLSINGTAATATAGTITPLLPAPPNSQVTATFWTASNAGAGTNQAGILHVPAGATSPNCLSPSCGNAGQTILPPGGTGSNYTVSVASTTATVNLTFLGRSIT